MSVILQKDTEIHFPHFMVLKASAGSGKTHTLTERFVQFLLSDRVERNSLRNILAITFSNNAAKEMKERILLRLKSVCLNDAEKIGDLLEIVSGDREKLREKAEQLVKEILDNYSDFQVKTIDSFMTSVFKASALDFGYDPEFEILLNGDSVMRYAFELFLRNVREGTKEAELFDGIVDVITDRKKKQASYLWDPSVALLDETKKIYRKLAATGKKPQIEDFSAEIRQLKTGIKNTVEDIEALIQGPGGQGSGLERSAGSGYRKILQLVRAGKFADIMDSGLKLPPVKKPKKKDGDLQKAYESIGAKWEELGCLIMKYVSLHVRCFYSPYLRVYEEFGATIEKIKQHQGKVFIEDINRDLASYLDDMAVPDIYFRLGERIFHFLIDEFQDTSPVQWKNLLPLMGESLAKEGSAFLVGDTKQAIYGFRDADYTIMKSVENRAHNPFPSAEHKVEELRTNYRSREGIIAFNEKVFKDILAGSDKYRQAGAESGLTDYVQEVKSGWEGTGLAEVTLLERDDDDPPERTRIQEIVAGLCSRGYAYGDIAVLTQTNEDAVRATIWLNEKGIPFISFSSLDIRRRKITGEVVALLEFLDSPTDDLAFSTVILGDILKRNLDAEFPGTNRDRLPDFLFINRGGRKNRLPLYKAFQQEFNELWDRYFAGLFRSSGYCPLYDLVSDLFSVFRVFELIPEEEATLVKILEVVKEFEGKGYNSIKDFLEFADDGDTGEAVWNMDVPKGLNAVKVMTIHKSKGLGFPVVIALLYEERSRGFDYIVKEEGDRACLLRINRKSMLCDPEFEGLYMEEALREMVNRLNTLYVGFTRPEEELYVVGVKGKKEEYPFDLLPGDLLPAAGPSPHDKPFRQAASASETGDLFSVLHHGDRIRFIVNTDEVSGFEERKRGEFIHRVLTMVDHIEIDCFGKGAGDDLMRIIENAQKETGTCYPAKEIAETVISLISKGETAEYFVRRPGRRIMTEQEFSDAGGNLFRMDRVIVDPGSVMVIDYKTGGNKAAAAGVSGEKNVMQVMNYIRLLGNIFPDKEIHGMIAYTDGGEVMRVV